MSRQSVRGRDTATPTHQDHASLVGKISCGSAAVGLGLTLLSGSTERTPIPLNDTRSFRQQYPEFGPRVRTCRRVAAVSRVTTYPYAPREAARVELHKNEKKIKYEVPQNQSCCVLWVVGAAALSVSSAASTGANAVRLVNKA